MYSTVNTGMGSGYYGTAIPSPTIFGSGEYYRDSYKPSNMEIAINQIIREEAGKIEKLNLENIQKMLNGNIEEKKLAVELLKDETKYLWKIMEEIAIHATNVENLGWIAREYYQKNLYNLNIEKEIC